MRGQMWVNLVMVLVACNSKSSKPSIIKENARINGKQDHQVLTKVDLYHFLQIYSLEKKQMATEEDSVSIYFLDSLRIIQCPLGVMEVSPDGQSYTPRDARKGEKIAYDYFVYQIGRPNGYSFRSGNDTLVLSFKVDSILKFKMFSEVNMKVQPYMRLVDSSTDRKGREKKTYVNTRPRANTSDSVTYIFDTSMNNIDYSISKHFDSTIGKKLVEAHLVMNPISIEGNEVPRRHLKFALKQKEITSLIHDLLEKYRKQLSK